MTHLASPNRVQGSQLEDISSAGPTTANDHFLGRNIISTLSEQRTSRIRPCDACRRRKSRCVVNEGAAKCVLCDFHSQDCTFLENLPPRKRKSVSCEDESDRSLPISSISNLFSNMAYATDPSTILHAEGSPRRAFVRKTMTLPSWTMLSSRDRLFSSEP